MHYLDQDPTVPPLVIEVLVRLFTFLQCLPPGLIEKERDLSERITQAKEYFELIQVIQRSEARLLAGIGPLPPHTSLQALPEQTDQKEEEDEGSHEVDFGFRVKVKKSKIQKGKKDMKVPSITVDTQKELQASDEAFLKKGNYPLPNDSFDIRNLKDCARRRIARVYVVSARFPPFYSRIQWLDLHILTLLVMVNRPS